MPLPTRPKSTEELKRSRDDEDREHADPQANPGADPKKQKSYTFNFDYQDSQGKSWSGSFTNKILTIGETQQAAVLQAKFQDGLPDAAIDEDQRAVNRIIAHMEYSLTDRPDWAEDLRELLDSQIVLKLWKEVASHEAIFWGSPSDQG